MEMEGVKLKSSECNSGCNSGWTMYLVAGYSCEDADAIPASRVDEGYRRRGDDDEGEEEEEEEEDEEEEESLSMASDASSGPPHAHDGSYDYNGHSYSASASSPPSASARAPPRSTSGKRQLGMQEQASRCDCMDDTASSPFLFGLSKESFELSNGDNCSRSSGNRAPGEKALEFSCVFSQTHLKDQIMQGGKKMRMTSSILL